MIARESSLQPEFLEALSAAVAGEVRHDWASRILYSTDASIYQIEPLGVVRPRTQDDLQAAVSVAARYGVPVLPRGSGTSLAGQAIGPALILDCSPWLNRILELEPDARTATVEPGVLLSSLNRAAAEHGLQFGPDPASADRATMGGVIANNATGAHSVLYGMAADHLVQAQVVLADGSAANFGELDVDQARAEPTGGASLEARITAAALDIRARYAQTIRERYPSTWRNSAGYRLNYLLPWSPSRPPHWAGESYPPLRQGTINLAHLLAGSEGTLAVIRSATVTLVPKPRHKLLAVLSFTSLPSACEAVPALLARHPSAIELIPQLLIRLARAHPAHSGQMRWVNGDPAAVLVVEFSGDAAAGLREAALDLGPDVLIAETLEEQNSVWSVRKVGLGILDSRPEAARPLAFIEDCAIPVENLGRFVREIERILRDHNTEGGIYAHASAGCLHIRPILDLQTQAGRLALRSIAEETVSAALQLGGSMSSEHGDGIARAEWLRQTYGPDVLAAMRQLKDAADPNGVLSPKKQLDAPAMDTHLRVAATRLWKRGLPATEASRLGSIVLAAERCNGQGLCRKETGLMCPSYQATRDEMHSTRGRANLLRALASQGTSGPGASAHARGHDLLGDRNVADSVKDALDLCLACQGCRAECPSGVDMAKLKSIFFSEYFRRHARPWRDYLLGNFHITAGALAMLSPISNWVLGWSGPTTALISALGISTKRPLPRFGRWSHRRQASQYRDADRPGRPGVLFLSDAYGRFVDNAAEQAAFQILAGLGYHVQFVPVLGSGVALMSKGMVAAAQKHASGLLLALTRIDPSASLPVLGTEPPELNALRGEYAEWLPGKAAEASDWSRRAMLVEEFLLREARDAILRIAIHHQTANLPPVRPKILLHAHCHQQAQSPAADGGPYGSGATLELLELCGFKVELSEGGCCGMGGTFGFEAEHYDLSMKIGELSLFPQIRSIVRDNGGLSEGGAAGAGAVVAATGGACRLQILHGTGARVVHPLVLVRDALFAQT